ncbi:ABC transporter substrate-binding protein [Pseudooceanicola sp. 200-1SW]|uniref:ABC transporter substrate-binding protein n=1 Tax=Pseudooceanicola sp. 200-1SW TaxID=3425949 RepID=UPI003D7F23D3
MTRRPTVRDLICLTLLTILTCLTFRPGPVAAQEAVARYGSGPAPFLLRSTTDISILGPVIERFAAAEPGLTITFEQWGSNALYDRARADCQGEGGVADAVFSSAVQQMVWLVNAACAAPYRSPATVALPETRRWRDELWGITTEPAVIVYNTRLLAGDEVPRSRFALLDALRAQPDRYRGRIATYDIGASGLGFLFAYADSLEATTFGSMMEAFARVGAVATCCSAEIIGGVAEGRYLIAYNVLGSYVAHAAAGEEVGTILPEDYTLVLSRGYMIPRGAAQAEAAGRLLEFLLTPEAQGMLAAAGLVADMAAPETGLAPSARRTIPLGPTLLVALDGNRRTQLLNLWGEAFQRAQAP